MPALAELQHTILRVMTANGGPSDFIVADGLSPAARLNVYRNTYIGTLTTALRLTYPAIHRLVGAEFFEAAAQLFIGEVPPRCAYLTMYGAEFAEFLARFPPAASLPYLAAVAHLEWAVGAALNAADAETLDATKLAQLASIAEDQVSLIPHPSVGFVRADFPAEAIWQATLAEDDASLASVDLGSGPVWLMVAREGDEVRVSSVTEAEWRFAAALCAGETLASALNGSQDIDAPEELARHLLAGRFIGFHIRSSTHS